MKQTDILLPIAAMMGLVAVVVGLMLLERVKDMRTLRIRPNDPRVASSSQMAATLPNTRAADNYKNLFEMPVLFYALCLALLFTQSVTGAWLAAAWVYVGLRVGHTVVHLAMRHVMLRFALFAASFYLLAGMWAVFAWQLITK